MERNPLEREVSKRLRSGSAKGIELKLEVNLEVILEVERDVHVRLSSYKESWMRVIRIQLFLELYTGIPTPRGGVEPDREN